MNIGDIPFGTTDWSTVDKPSIKESKALHIGELRTLATSEFVWLNTARDT
ncbi:Uncharacterised protein [Yersinia enterocolitica]|nr:hypothetical protein CH47_1399 [Yersinia enterocolitica]VTP76982.1 Uncharacterised protein [Yersinia enterocolitica subsp. enterocolitica]KGA71744.1 hypothetical protein DJ59_578 [Yersinia enterocolitica]KGA77958.1 hypothetical protein DJ60_637 [Yersinia enterocolitica]CFQ17708.1 Uncharacterised protein [Yersinia enterocolitica]